MYSSNIFSLIGPYHHGRKEFGGWGKGGALATTTRLGIAVKPGEDIARPEAVQIGINTYW